MLWSLYSPCSDLTSTRSWVTAAAPPRLMAAGGGYKLQVEEVDVAEVGALAAAVLLWAVAFSVFA